MLEIQDNWQTKKAPLSILTLILKAIYCTLHDWLEHETLEFAVRTEESELWSVSGKGSQFHN